MYNTSLTQGFNNKPSISRKYKLVFDDEGKVICGISKNDICDLNGIKIASFACKENVENSKVKQLVYSSNSFGTFRLIGNVLFYNDRRIGVTRNGPNKSSVLLLLVTCMLLLITFGIVSIIEVPNTQVPVIVLNDTDGVVDVDRRIGVFNPSISPNSSGEYHFNIQNTNGKKMSYSLDVFEYYDGEIIENFPVRYRLKMNNLYINDESTWLHSSELSFKHLYIQSVSTQEFTLEWYWPFDSGNDTLDTYFGTDNGEYSIVISLKAEFVEGE